jgi:hypothetical protein
MHKRVTFLPCSDSVCNVLRRYYMAPGLSALVHLTSLTLSPVKVASLCGSIEHAPALSRLELSSTARGTLLQSSTLTSLTIGSHNVSATAS